MSAVQIGMGVVGFAVVAGSVYLIAQSIPGPADVGAAGQQIGSGVGSAARGAGTGIGSAASGVGKGLGSVLEGAGKGVGGAFGGIIDVGRGIGSIF